MKRIHIPYFITNFFFHTKRGFQLMKLGWKDHDWDYGFLLDIEYKKILWMRNYFAKSEIAINDKRRAFELNIVLKMLDIIRENDTADEIVDINAAIGKAEFRQTKYVNTKNASRFLLSQSLIDRVNEDSSFGVIIRNTLRIEKAWYLYNEWKKNYMRGWWN